MEHMHDKRTLLTSIGLVLLGIMIGAVICTAAGRPQQPGMHRMPDGSMMMNDGTSMDMHSMMMDMSASLRDKEGAEFDQEFLRQMIVHHEGAVDMAEMVIQKSQQPELRQMAQAIIAAQTAEIAQMKAWLEKGF